MTGGRGAAPGDLQHRGGTGVGGNLALLGRSSLLAIGIWGRATPSSAYVAFFVPAAPLESALAARSCTSCSCPPP